MNCELFSSKPTRILASLVLLMVLIALGTYASLNLERAKYLDPNPATISVSGTGEVLAVPDIGVFSFSVRAEADTADVAQEQSGTSINEIIAYLKEEGIADTDIKTVSYNLFPRYRYEERACAFGSYCPPGEQIQDGFEVVQTIEVKVRQTDQAGAIIAGVGERGATDISGLQFTIDDDEAIKDEARAKAIADAKEKAGVLAEQLGVRVVKLQSYSESGDYYPKMFEARAVTLDSAEDSGFGGAEIPTGEQATTITVNLIYEIR